MTAKTVFFDIDGTLLSSRNGREFQIPASTLEALRLLKQNGHRAAVCTGRQEAFIHRFFPGLFDSYVAMNGTHVVFEGKTVLDRPFSAQRLAELMEHFDAYGCSYIFLGQRNGWTRNVPGRLLDRLNYNYGLPDFLVTEWEPGDVRANMMDLIFENDGVYKRQAAAFTGDMILNRHPGVISSDLSFRGWNKAQGILEFIRYGNIARQDTVAFGDGGNDIGMMETVDCAVAMGNAVPEIKQAADYVTTNIFDDGIFNGLKHLGLI